MQEIEIKVKNKSDNKSYFKKRTFFSETINQHLEFEEVKFERINGELKKISFTGYIEIERVEET